MKRPKKGGAAPGSGGRTLASLVSIGPAMLRDFELLGVRSVDELARAEPGELFERLCRLTGSRQDPCVLDTFCAAVAQARDPDLPAPMREWWYWSRVRKAAEGAKATPAKRAEGAKAMPAKRAEGAKAARAGRMARPPRRPPAGANR
ncbi:MAG TPA: helix-hairpin-helix domain-containing protein [Polyangiaceae bacterium]|nr:helix-hairpin-helix domain-containing protein [Polyangiaceae bacterium]